MGERQFRCTRAEAAEREIGRPELSRRMAWTLALLFLAMLLGGRAASALRENVEDVPVRIRHAPQRAISAFSETEGTLLRRLLAANRSLLRDMEATETHLENDSSLTDALAPPMQLFLTRYLGVGNEMAYVGRNGWLFYRPSVDYLTGRGFLDPSLLARRAASGNEWTAAPQPDPRTAIIEFRDQLAEHGVALVVAPVAVKAGLHAERLSSRYDGQDRVPLHNASYDAFVEDLRTQNVLVWDEGYSTAPQYLATDTHWRPETMSDAAESLAGFVRAHVDLSPSRGARYRRVVQESTNQGDVARMLRLPENQSAFPPETVTIQQVLSTTDEFWRPSASADILLMGDSFSNIYSSEAMGWGRSAGLAEQVSFHLQRPLDVVSRNDEGAWATREILSRDLARGRDRLAGKRVVVWQFSERELAFGDWRSVAMQLGEKRPARFVVPPQGEDLVVSGLIEGLSGMPRPGSVVYADHIFSAHLGQLRDADGRAIPEGEALVYLFSMRDHAATRASRLRPGQEVRLRLSSWASVEERWGSVRRSELDDEDLLFEEPCWGEMVEEGDE